MLMRMRIPVLKNLILMILKQEWGKLFKWPLRRQMNRRKET
jgi:hypothetical protein